MMHTAQCGHCKYCRVLHKVKDLRNFKLPFDPPKWFERRAEKDWKSPHSRQEFRCQFDFLHPTYPESPLDMLPRKDQIAMRKGPNDRLSSLPVELFEKIILLLPTSDLEAVRYVSYQWYIRIMTNDMLLRAFSSPFATTGACTLQNVLFPAHLQINEPEPLRDLARRFDKKANPHALERLRGYSRIRYRANDVKFQPPTGQDQRILDTAIYAMGGMVGFLIGIDSNPGVELRRRYSILIYMIRVTGDPFLVRDLDLPTDCGKPISINFLKGSFPENWILELNTKDQHYCMTSFIAARPPQATPSYAGAMESIFGVKPQSPFKQAESIIFKSPDSWVMGTWTKELSRRSKTKAEIDRGDYNRNVGAWCFVEALPVARSRNQERFMLPILSNWVAQYRRTGELFIVTIRNEADWEGRLSLNPTLKKLIVTPINLLCSPYKHNCYKNLAIAPYVYRTDNQPAARFHIVITWSEKADTVDCPGILFLYDIPANYVNQPATREYHGITDDDCSYPIRDLRCQEKPLLPGELRLLDPDEYIPDEYGPPQRLKYAPRKIPDDREGRIYGKRVCSLPANFGGIHPFCNAPVRRQQYSLLSRGGIQLVGLQYLQCFVWGPPPSASTNNTLQNTSQEGITVKVLDIPKYETRLLKWPRAGPSRDSTLQFNRYNILNFFTSADGSRYVLPELTSCACEIHDTTWAVTFPPPPANNKKRKRWENSRLGRLHNRLDRTRYIENNDQLKDDFFLIPKVRAAKVARAARAARVSKFGKMRTKFVGRSEKKMNKGALKCGTIAFEWTPVATAALERRDREIQVHLDRLKARTRQGFGSESTVE